MKVTPAFMLLAAGLALAAGLSRPNGPEPKLFEPSAEDVYAAVEYAERAANDASTLPRRK